MRTEAKYRKKLVEIKKYFISDMRYPEDRSRFVQVETGKEEVASLISAIYRIRCNLFHGRKDVSERHGTDRKLVYLAYDLLFPIFVKYVKKHVR